MAELTPAQQRAIAIARARAKLSQSSEVSPPTGTGFQSHAESLTPDQMATAIKQPGIFGDWLRERADQQREATTTGPAVYQGISDTLSFGLADEIASAVTGTPIDEVRELAERNRQLNPDAYSTGSVTGAAAGAALPIGGALAVTRGANLPTQTIASGLAAAGTSALQGFNEGEGGFDNRVANALQPGPVAISGAVGAAAPGMGRIAEALISAGRRAPGLRQMGMSRPAASKLMRRFEEDTDIRDVRAYLAELGPDATLADAGPSLRGLAAGGVAKTGPQRPEIFRAMDARGEAAPARINDAIDQALGQRVNMTEASDALRRAHSAEARQAYDAFNATSVPLTDDLRAMLRRADEVGALRGAQQVAAARGSRFDPADYLDPEAVEINGEALDLISRALRDSSKKAWRDGQGALGEALGDLNSRFVGAAPGLRAIRRQYADRMTLREAAEGGADVLNNKISADEFSRSWRDMSDGERAAFRASARDAIEQKLAGAIHERNAGVNLLGPRTTVAKLETAFGADAVAELRRAIQAERVFRDTSGKVIANSETAARQSSMRDWGQDHDADGIPIGPKGAARRVLGGAWQGAGRAVGGGSTDRVSRDLSRALTATGSERDRIVAALIDAQLRRQARGDRAATAGRLVQLLTGAGSGVSSDLMRRSNPAGATQ